MRRKLTHVAATAGATSSSDPAALLTVRELAQRLRISRRTVSDRVRDGTIPSIKLGKRRLFSWPSVEEALLRRERRAEA